MRVHTAVWGLERLDLDNGPVVAGVLPDDFGAQEPEEGAEIEGACV